MTDKDLLKDAKERYKAANEGWQHIYDAAKEDLNFVYDVGDGQWPSQVRKDRGARPIITVNKLQKFVRQLRGDAAMNRPRIKVIPVDSQGDPKMAELYNALIRQIEYMSSAEIAYDTAYAHAVACSVGYFRLITKYANDDSFDQDIYIKRIIDPLSVHFDPAAVEFTLEDGKYCFIEDIIPKTEFNRIYKGAEAMNFDGMTDLFGDWLSNENIRIAEYFWKEPVKKRLVMLRSGEVIEVTKEIPIERIVAAGGEIVRERAVDTHVVKWAKINGAEVLEQSEWPGTNIPIIPVFGDEIIADGKRHYLSLARGAKGPQQMYNYWARLSLDTPIPTPDGWTTMGDVKDGDTLFDENGKRCHVLGLSPVFNNRPCFKITFSNNTSIVADDEHLWDVEELNGKMWEQRTLHTIELDPQKHRIRVAKPLDLQENELPIPPYALGLWITDGDSRHPKICANRKTVDELMEYIEALGIKTRKGMLCKASETFGIAMLGIRKDFTRLNLLQNKHIPQGYLRGSFDQRLSLLQGMMDGDGTCKENGQCCFATHEECIANDFADLLRGLGFKGAFHKQADGMYCFAFAPRDFPVFRLKYKLDRQFVERGTTTQSDYYKIESIESVESVPVRCVRVDSPNSLFLAGRGMIPTHNTAATENVALSPKAPFIVDHRQIKGFEREWEDANVTNRMFIRYNAVAGLPKPQREQQTQVPAAIIGMLNQTAFDIEDHLGRYESSKGEASNERSGKAIQARIQQSDKGTYTFVDNLTRAIVYAGRQIIDLIPKIYDTERALRIQGETGEQSVVTVNTPVSVDDAGNVTKANDLSVGKYDLIATTGASYGSKRQEMVQMMIEAMQYAPAIAPVIAPLVFKYSDWPGADEIYAEIKNAIQQQSLMGGEDLTGGMPPTP